MVDSFEIRRISKDGRLLDIWSTATRLPDKHGQSIAIALTSRDITERKRAESSLRESEERFRLLFENSLDAIVVTDDNGNYLMANLAASQLLGYPREQLLGMKVADLVTVDSPDDGEQFAAYLQAGCDVGRFRFLASGPGGAERIAEYTATKIAPGRHMSILRDVTEREKFQRELLRREQEFKALVENDPDIVARFDRNFRHVYVNSAVEAITGLPPSRFLGKTNRELGMPERLCSEWELKIEQVFETSQPQQVEFDFESPDKTRYFSSRLVPEFDATGQVETVLAVTRDISDRIVLQRELLTIVAEKQRHIGQDLHDSVGQKLTGLGMLAGSLAESLQQHSPADAEAANRITRGVEETLEEVRKLSKGLVPVEIDAEGLRAALTELAEATHHDSGIKCDFDCDQPVRIENNEVATHLYRIVQEAVTNALKHGAPKHVTISLAEGESEVILGVRDDGRGISTEALKAQGIGLKTMQYRAALIGATLSISPVKRRGTLVTCRLPESRNHGKTPDSGQ